MNTDGVSPLTLADLERLLQAADPAALLVAPRVVRRVIKHICRATGIGLSVPHRKSLVLNRDTLLQVVDGEELGLAAGRELPPTVILLARPELDKLAALPRGEALVKYWRRLFHAHVHLVLDRRLATHQLTPAAVRERIHRIGQTQFDEIRAVLRQEHYLLAPRDQGQVYTEFAAVYLELRYFARHLLVRYFPTLGEIETIDAILAQDVDADRLFAATRLDGAPEPTIPAVSLDEEPPAPAEVEDSPAPSAKPQGKLYRLFMSRADQASRLGNVVRAALLRTWAVRVARGERADTARAGVRAELARLSVRLQAALGLDETAADQWRRALAPLVDRAARGIWPVEARLLYDLQKACIDHERAVYAVDLVAWVVSLGRRPVKRQLSSQREVLLVKHLRSAAQRLTAARLSDKARRRLSDLLGAAVERSKEHLRACIRPRLTEAFQEAGMQPHNLPERVAVHKLTEELLDRVRERGFLTMGDLRDAVSRNRLKLPDLSGPKEFFLGDRLLRINGQLGRTLDGVYHRGEVYLRWLQRLSALAFATRPGRFITRYVLLPFGGAYAILEAVQHLIHLGLKLVQPEPHEADIHLASPLVVVLLGTVLLGLLNVAAFRKQVLNLLKAVAQGFRVALFDLPTLLLRLPFVRRMLASRPVRFFRSYLLKPLVFTAVTAVAFPLAGSDATTSLLGTSLLFLGGVLFCNSRWGRTAEEMVGDWILSHWRYLRLDMFPAVFRFVMDLFKSLLESLDRLLYTVDEWLRFRSGESQLVLIGKVALGTVWSGVTYLVRIYMNVFIEPQVNPIKHFPAVTVGAKLILPFSLILADLVAAQLMPLGTVAAHAIAFFHVWLLPGMFGFLVWELKENWRLYQANQAQLLQPVLIGHHGETMLRLLQPGFHSGTLPKLYSKLRRALRRGDGKAARKQRRGLEQVEESLRQFVERELMKLLEDSRGWGHTPLHVGAIRTGSNRVGIELRSGPEPEPDLWVAFEEQSGWLVGSIAKPGWLAQLTPEQLRACRAALAGLYKMAGVDLIREQIEASFAPFAPSYDIADEGLVVWPGSGYEIEIVYNLHAGPLLQPQPLGTSPPLALPGLPATPLLFRQVPLPWHAWVAFWQQDQTGGGLPVDFLDRVCVLPRLAEGKATE